MCRPQNQAKRELSLATADGTTERACYFAVLLVGQERQKAAAPQVAEQRLDGRSPIGDNRAAVAPGGCHRPGLGYSEIAPVGSPLFRVIRKKNRAASTSEEMLLAEPSAFRVFVTPE